MTILNQIATRMQEQAQQEPGQMVRRTLGEWRGHGDGLRLTVRWKPVAGQAGDWYLGLWRMNGAPGETEVRVCRAAFRVPEAVRLSGRIQKGQWSGYFFIWPAGRKAEG